MRNLKRALSLALASIMVLGMMVIGAGAASYDKFSDKDDIVHKDAVSMVTELGIIAGLPDGSYGPTQNIDRASFARLICVALNGGNEPLLGATLKTSFSDTQNNWAEKYIAYCVDRGIVAGKGNNTFAPSANVTGSEAAKMLLVALGYDTTNEGIGGATWQVRTDVLANGAGLYKDLKTLNTSEALTRDQAAQMIYNALNADMVSYSYTYTPNGTTTVLNKTGETMLEDKFGVTVVEGIVVANEYASVIAKSSSSSSKKAGETQIVVTGDDGVSGTYDVESTVDMLGQKVTLYVDYKNSNSTSGATVIGTPVLSSDNVVYTSVNGDDMDDVTDDNDLTIADDALFFYNYGATTEAKLAIVAGGALKVIDNDNDSEIDYVIYTQYTAGAVTAKSTTDDGYLTINGLGKIEDSDDIVGFDDVEKKDFVLAVQYGGKTYVEKPETVTGTLKAYSVSKGTVTIDGTTYDMSGIACKTGNADPELTNTIAAYVEKSAIDVEATFYLDNNGAVVAVGEADEANLQYAILLGYENKTDAGTSGSGTLGRDAKAKLLLADGTKATYVVAKINNADPTTSSFDADNQYDAYTYTITSDDEVKLVHKMDSEKTADNNKVSFDSGKTSLMVGTTRYSVSSDTVFLYMDGSDVTRYVGKDSAPDISSLINGVDVTVAVKGTSKSANLVFINAKSAERSGDYIYLYTPKMTQVSDGALISALVNGEKKDIIIDNFTDEQVKDDNKNTLLKDSTLGLYPYTVDGSGDDAIYSLGTKSSTLDNVINLGVTVVELGSDYLVTSDDDFTLTNDTIVVGVENKKVDTGKTLDEGDIVTVVANDDGEVLYAFITTDYVDDGTGSSGSTSAKVDSIVLADPANSAIVLKTTLTENVADDEKAVITAQYQRSSNDGETWVNTGSVKTATIDAGAKSNDEITANCTDGYLYRVVVTIEIQSADDDTILDTIADEYVTNMVEGYKA